MSQSNPGEVPQPGGKPVPIGTDARVETVDARNRSGGGGTASRTDATSRSPRVVDAITAAGVLDPGDQPLALELRRARRGHMLRTVSSQRTEVDGQVVQPGEEAQVRPGTTVRLAQVMTLKFLGSEQSDSPRDAATLQHGVDGALRRVTGSDGDEVSTGPPPPPRV
jgi:hypothetical protein